jgi:hypothetical protein
MKQLRRNHVKEDDLFIFYTAFIRLVVEYACPAWHPSLTIEQSNHIEHIQKRASSTIYGNIDYELFCVTHNIDSLNSRRAKLCRQFFKDIAENSDNCLNYLLSDRRPVDVYNLRSANRFFIPIA